MFHKAVRVQFGWLILNLKYYRYPYANSGLCPVAGAIKLPGNLVSQPFFEKETRSKDVAASFFLTVIWPRFRGL
jgi:hypothetical protein